ncbi:MAG: hypothetical protein E7586_06270 [Ruminococcaceae bacterium]|nr:hypothetical protein [Oscillospiraceae bacterium]
MYAETVVIYADLLFVINFSMDFLCLFITDRLLGCGRKALPLTIASVLGALYGFLPYSLNLPSAIIMLGNLVAAGVITLTAFGRQSLKRFFRTTAVFMVSSALMGGLITAIYNSSGKYHDGVYTEMTALSFAVICLISALTALCFGLIFRKKINTPSAEVCISIKDRQIRARLIADSGNLVTEPFSALPVIILSSSVLPKPYDNPESEFFPLSVRAIPFSTATGKSCFLGFRPDKIEIIRLGKKPTPAEAYVAVDTSNNNYSGYDGILPTSIL